MKKAQLQSAALTNQKIVNCFTGSLIERGNKIRAQRIFADMLKYLSLRKKGHPLSILKRGLSKIRPIVEISTSPRGTGVSHKTRLISESRSFGIAIHWFLKEVEKKPPREAIALRLAREVLKLVGKKKTVLAKRRRLMHKQAIYSRRFTKIVPNPNKPKQRRGC